MRSINGHTYTAVISKQRPQITLLPLQGQLHKIISKEQPQITFLPLLGQLQKIISKQQPQITLLPLPGQLQKIISKQQPQITLLPLQGQLQKPRFVSQDFHPLLRRHRHRQNFQDLKKIAKVSSSEKIDKKMNSTKLTPNVSYYPIFNHNKGSAVFLKPKK